MKVYTKIVIDIAGGDRISEESYNYEGPLALAGGSSGGGAGATRAPEAGRIVRNLYRQGGLKPRLEGILAPNENDPFYDLASKRLANDINAQYGARGLATSGIGMKGVTEALTNFGVAREEQKADQAIKILSTASGGPTPVPQQQGRGFMGLK